MYKPKQTAVQTYEAYLKAKAKQKRKIFIWQMGLLIGFIALWEILARCGILNTFLFSSPSAIWDLFKSF